MPFSRTTSYTCLLKVTSLKAFSSQQSLALTQFWLHFYPTLPSSFHSGDDRVSPASFQSPVSELFSWLLHILCCARSVTMMPEMLFGHSFVLSWILAILPFVFLTDRGPLASFSIWHFLKCRCPLKGILKTLFSLYDCYGTLAWKPLQTLANLFFLTLPINRSLPCVTGMKDLMYAYFLFMYSWLFPAVY